MQVPHACRRRWIGCRRGDLDERAVEAEERRAGIDDGRTQRLRILREVFASPLMQGSPREIDSFAPFFTSPLRLREHVRWNRVEPSQIVEDVSLPAERQVVDCDDTVLW